ncbi:hypothetical protein HPB47_009252 [Ixodes persulcatus]|uniref:Uncharacterized protein n=1 Tax=Ixodes persulcatus TaxID=34615 RepID=A0AC60P2I6_IXOPE|nr:hypothetical protein HPB47_009252 [Ixodes persulcatus]
MNSQAIAMFLVVAVLAGAVMAVPFNNYDDSFLDEYKEKLENYLMSADKRSCIKRNGICDGPPQRLLPPVGVPLQPLGNQLPMHEGRSLPVARQEVNDTDILSRARPVVDIPPPQPLPKIIPGYATDRDVSTAPAPAQWGSVMSPPERRVNKEDVARCL